MWNITDIPDKMKKFFGGFAPLNSMNSKPPAAPIANDRNRIETSRPIRDRSEESQRPSTRDGNQFYSGSVFVPTQPPPGRRISIDSSTERDSPTATRKTSHSSIQEFRKVEKTGHSSKGRPRRAPDPYQSSRAPKPSPKLLSTSTGKPRKFEEIEDDDVSLLIVQQPSNQKLERATTRNSGHVVDLTEEGQGSRSQLTINVSAHPGERPGRKRTKDDSPDELNNDEYRPQQPNKRARVLPAAASRGAKSASLSTKGDIGSAFPQRAAGAGRGSRDLPQFHVIKAVCPPRFICDDAQALVPRHSDPGILDPVPLSGRDFPMANGQQAAQYEWLQVCLAKMKRLSHNPSRRHVIIERPIVKDYGSKLHLEFSGTEDARKFVDWVTQQLGHNAESVIKHSEHTEKQFGVTRENIENARVQAEKNPKPPQSKGKAAHDSKINRQEAIPSDVILMSLNLRRERDKGDDPLCGPDHNRHPSAKKRLRENMVDDATTTGCDEDVQEVKRPKSERRSTRLAPGPSEAVAINPRIESPPPAIPWTVEHAGWDKDWRLPLTYLRTTIHKEDVARLDDGEFLNDSIISFYLNYLHNRLKATNKDAAARFYFHNSFFYERLKPVKGKCINYDSVKSWTSRVDIFKYDYIIVPVNEHSHWWVAIICNPGKLVLDEPASGPEVCAAKSVANEPGSGPRDGSENTGQSPKRISETPEKPSKDRSTPPSPDMSPGTASVRDRMGSMSLSQQDTATSAKQTPILIDDGPDNHVIIPDDEVPEIPLVVSDIVSLDNPKKAKETVRVKEPAQTGKSLQAQEPVLPTGKEPRVITLDSLGSAHSPACTHLKQYLREELLDKKKQQVEMPATFGLTAKFIPLQSNYWDCGAYLLSYIDLLMKDPDASIKAILEKRSPGWHVDASKMRSEIRDVIIKEHAAYQKRQEAAAKAKQEQKRLRKERAAASPGATSSQAPPTSSEAGPLPSSPPDVVVPSLRTAASPEDVARPSIEHSNSSIAEIPATS